MGLIEQAKSDIARFTSNDREFGIELILTAPDGETATINGLHTKHHLSVDTDGNIVNAKNAHIAFSETILEGYPLRINGEVNLNNHRISAKDSTGVLKHYKIKQWFPDETVGLIVCILQDYE